MPINVTVEQSGTFAALETLANRSQNPGALHRIWAPLATAGVDRNFQRQSGAGRAWEPLAPLTIAIKGHSRILHHDGNLRRGIRALHDDTGVVVGPAEEHEHYAYIQQYGGEAGPNPPNKAVLELADGEVAVVTRRVQIPARPYNQLSEFDIDQLEDAAVRFFEDD